MKIDRSPQYGESGLFFCFYLKSGHKGSKSLRVIIIFKPQRFRSFPVMVIKVIKDFRLSKYPSIL